MSTNKRLIRAKFRASVFSRDKYLCQMCDCIPQNTTELDAHHITDRNEMPNGGYVMENGIALCNRCHERAEQFHKTGEPYPGYTPYELYVKIGSSYDQALDASRKL